MSSFLSCVVNTLPHLGGISFAYTPQGIASCGFLRADSSKTKLLSTETGLASGDLETYYIEATQPALVTIEASDWPPPRCVDYKAIVLGAFFPFEGNARLPYGTPGTGATPETRLIVSYGADGVLTLKSKSSTQSYDLSSYAVQHTIRVFVCLRSTNAGDVTATHLATGTTAEVIR